MVICLLVAMEGCKFNAPLWLQVLAKRYKCQPDLLTKTNLVKLSSAARETERNNFPCFFPILVSIFFPNNFAELLIFFITQKLFVFPACVPCNLYLDFLGRIPKRVSVNRSGVALCRISPVIAYREPEVWGPIQSCRPWPEVCLLLKSKKLDSE